ncbi:MAG: glycosyltransferase [Hymenobacter sp.]|nr:MAG: glycosyltransferase [Hymenobacter sp.]
MKKSNISIVIPTYQAEATIIRAIESVIHEQLVSNVFVIDDGSTDGTEKTVNSLQYDKLVFKSGINSGACYARNRGLNLSNDEYILFLDSDDYVEAGYIQQFQEHMEHKPDLIIAGHRHIDVDGMQIRTVTYSKNLKEWELLAEYINNPIQTSGFLWNRKWLLDGGGWDETFPIFQDAEISIRMLLRDPKVSIIGKAEKLAVWVESGAATRITNNISRKKIAAMHRGLLLHKNEIVSTGNISAINGLASRLYELARKSYSRGFDDIGDLCIVEVRKLSNEGHIGSYSHRLLCNLIGLKAKIQLSEKIKKILVGKKTIKNYK